MLGWRMVVRAAVITVAVLTLGACAVESPRLQEERQRKAAGISKFRLTCTQDLWERTGGDRAAGQGTASSIPAKTTKRADGLVTFELTGPNLVDLLKYLDRKAHPGRWMGRSDAFAARMYNAIAPRVDAVRPTPRADNVIPEVVIDDASGGSPSATSSPSATPDRSPSR
jgi:hypothetical protein